MTNTTTTDPATILAAIIREADGPHRLGAAALAEAILDHPASQWGPALPVPTDAEIKADFRAWFKGRYGTDYFGGISLFDAIAWEEHLLQQSPQPAAPWPELPDSPPLDEPGSGFRDGPSDFAWFEGRLQGWQLARAELERQREQAGIAIETINWRDLCAELLKGLDENKHEEVSYPGHLRVIMGQARDALRRHLEEVQPPAEGEVAELVAALNTDADCVEAEHYDLCNITAEQMRRIAKLLQQRQPAPTFPSISDSLVRSLIGNVLDESKTATEAACMDRPYNPVPRIRARLTEILQLAAQDQAAERPAS